MLLGVNIDHIASLREARKINEPDPLDALHIVKIAGASQITIHLREDRRHIDDDDTRKIIESSILPINLECSLESGILDIVCKERPFRATIVPEKREEVTTEGGMDIDGHKEALLRAVDRFGEKEIYSSIFIDPTIESVQKSKELGVDMVEIHTGRYANLNLMLYSNLSRTKRSIKELEMSKERLKEEIAKEIERIRFCSLEAKRLGLEVAAGHGLNYQNVKEIAKIDEIEELNIGQSIIARSIFVGLERAIKEMLECIK